MTHRRTYLWLPFFMLAMLSMAGASLAEDEAFCLEAQAELKGQIFTAKEPLFETKIGLDGILSMERDGEEVRQGAKTILKKVECGSKRVAVTLRPDGPGSKVEIYFMISRDVRQDPEARKAFDRMMTFVLESAPGAVASDW